MISDRVIANCIEEVKAVAGIDLMIVDAQLTGIADTGAFEMPDRSELKKFIDSFEDRYTVGDRVFIRIKDEDETAFILIARTNEQQEACVNLAAVMFNNLMIAYRDKIDRNSFFQNLLLDNLLPVDIYNRARKLHVEAIQKRCVFIVEPLGSYGSDLIEMIRELFYTEAGDYVTAVDEDHIVVIKALEPDEGTPELEETAKMLIDMAGSEALSDVRVAYGTVAEDVKGVSRSYKEAKMALEISRIFYPQKRCIEYNNLGVGRLIYQLPVSLCHLYVREIFGDDIPEEIDEEVLTTVNKFFENNLNVSETSRQLYIHRNTLIYRIEKLQKATGLDVRVFDDALALKIALMVVNYMKYVSQNEQISLGDNDHSIPRSST